MLPVRYNPTENQHQQHQTKSGRIRNYRSKPFRIHKILISTLLNTNFGISDPWEAAESEKEEEELENQKFTYKHSITENPEVETLNIQTQQQLKNPEIETPNIRMPPNQRNQNPELINQQNLPLVIVIDQPPINPVAKLIQQPLQLSPQQPGQQQLLQQPLQSPNLDPIAYTPIAKLDNFTGKEDDTQIWLNNDTTNSWYQSLVNKPQDFNAFKVEFLRYFSNNNSINCLVNAFTTIKQGETEAVTTYLRCFHRNLCQIQAIDANYFTAPQILNQFIHGLHSSILQHIRSLHPGILQDAVTRARYFESAKSEANHAQAINLVINRLSELDSKLEKFSELINKRLEGYLADNHVIYQPLQRHNNQGNSNHGQNQLHPSLSTNQQWQQETHICHYCGKQGHIQIDSAATSNISTAATNYLSTPTNLNTNPEPSSNNIRQPSIQIVYQPISSSLNLPSGLCTWNLDTSHIQNPNSQHYLSLLVTPENATSNNTESNQHILTNTIPPATISSDKSLAAIFLFELEENTPIPLFSRAALEEKPITAMYMDARVDGHSIKLILDSESAGSIITKQLMDQLGHRVDRAASTRIITANGVTKTPIGKIDNFPFEVNSIVTPIKVLVMEATQYQAFVGNDWLFKVNATLDWNIQELQLMYQGQHICVPAMCGHFKTPPREKLLIELEKEKEKPTWEAYQVLWADEEHNELPPILS
ncbi:hypothetical protein G9A89_019961 [Geosiphon pyriformis]|nr:hypothetical protein G9A89_019961 [Geosiphon pyriformis]